MFEAGDVVLAKVQYTDTPEIKQRPAVILFNEMGNIVIAGITSNTKMKGIPLTKKDGAVKDSVIKLNYIFTVSQDAIAKVLFRLDERKRKEVYQNLCEKLNGLNE